MIKQILFDCGGVLVELRFRELMLRICGSEECANYFFSRLWAPESPWQLYDRGDLTTEEIAGELKKYMPAELHPYLEEFVVRCPEGLPPMAGMEQLVDELHELGYPCYLLSNFSERFEEMPARTPVLNKLDGMVVSYRIHLIKPDPRIYLHTIEALGIRPEETLFVDDSPANIEAAKKAGMEGYVFTSPADFRAHLQDRSILPQR